MVRLFCWPAVAEGGPGAGGWDKLGSDYHRQLIARLQKTLKGGLRR